LPTIRALAAPPAKTCRTWAKFYALALVATRKLVVFFRYAWRTLDAATREKVRAEISSMLDWCLANSYQPDGSFKVSDLDDTLRDVYSYGVSFLRETRYFRREDRFWTDQDFPEAKVVRDRIEAKGKSIGLHDTGLKDA
jgi:hypothetical protein